MRSLLLLLLWAFPLSAADPVAIGNVLVDAHTRTISFPAKVNQDGEIAEFLLVHKSGKVHEALFSTEVSAVHLAAGLSLLGHQPDAENRETVPEKIGNLQDLPKVVITVSKDQKSWIPATAFIHYKGGGEAPAANPWRITGSYFWKGNFMAEVEGDLIAIYTNLNALIIMDHTDRTDDTVWFSNSSALGKKGDPITIRLHLPNVEK